MCSCSALDLDANKMCVNMISGGDKSAHLSFRSQSWCICIRFILWMIFASHPFYQVHLMIWHSHAFMFYFCIIKSNTLFLKPLSYFRTQLFYKFKGKKKWWWWYIFFCLLLSILLYLWWLKKSPRRKYQIF